MSAYMRLTVRASVLAATLLGPATLAQTSPPSADALPAGDNALLCKGLEELPCRKNKVCTWIIPKEANKAGEVPSPYCRKLGPVKKKPPGPGSGEPPPTPPPVDAPPKN